MKILKHKNIMGLIYSALLCMPLLAIGVRSAYVVVNKNAYQSYSQTNVYENKIVEIDNSTQMYEDLEYSIYYKNNNETNNSAQIGYSKISLDITTFTQYNSNFIYTYFAVYGNSNSVLIFTEDLTNYAYKTNWDEINNFTFTYNGNINQPSNLNKGNSQVMLITLKSGTLDNVFEYSVNKFVSENNLGEINMFSWFTNLFLSDNATNNLYVGFANWYMNYAMLISCMHLLFLVLMWFVNYSRRLLDRGMNYDW